jgi:ABC-2 type transport system permease protein
MIMGYIMQNFGLTSGYGAFQFASIVAVVGLFEVYNTATKNIMDIDGDRNISYYLTLPARPAVVLLSMACSYALISTMLTVVLLPFGKLVLYSSFNSATISWVRFGIMAILANIFFAIFTIAMIGHVGTMSKMRNIWMRFIWPLWFLGCYQFSWKSIYFLSAPFAYLLLCNPITFVTEGMRGALLGSVDFLPWEICCVALCCYITVCWSYAYYKMKRLLDFV